MWIVIAALFWVGLFWTVREWLYARKHGLTITRTEKLYLAMALPLIFGEQLVFDLVGIAPEVATTGSALAMGVASIPAKLIRVAPMSVRVSRDPRQVDRTDERQLVAPTCVRVIAPTTSDGSHRQS